MIKYDLSAVIGTYEKNGETKNISRTIGKFWQGDDGKYKMLLNSDFNPASGKKNEDGTIWINFYEQKPKGEYGSQTTAEAYDRVSGGGVAHNTAKTNGYTPQPDLNDEIPF